MDRGNGSKSDTTVKSLYFLNSLKIEAESQIQTNALRLTVGRSHQKAHAREARSGKHATTRSEEGYSYCFHTTGGPLTRFPLRSTVTSTRSAIVTKGMPLFIP